MLHAADACIYEQQTFGLHYFSRHMKIVYLLLFLGLCQEWHLALACLPAGMNICRGNSVAKVLENLHVAVGFNTFFQFL